MAQSAATLIQDIPLLTILVLLIPLVTYRARNVGAATCLSEDKQAEMLHWSPSALDGGRRKVPQFVLQVRTGLRRRLFCNRGICLSTSCISRGLLCNQGSLLGWTGRPSSCEPPPGASIPGPQSRLCSAARCGEPGYQRCRCVTASCTYASPGYLPSGSAQQPAIILGSEPPTPGLGL